MNIEQRISFFRSIAVMAPVGDDEAMRIDHIDESDNSAVVYMTGEDTGEQYCMDIEEILMDDYVFYQLTVVTPKSISGVTDI